MPLEWRINIVKFWTPNAVADPGFPRGGGANSPGGVNIRLYRIFIKTA